MSEWDVGLLKHIVLVLHIIGLLADLRETVALWNFMLHGCRLKCHLHFPTRDIIQDRVYNFMKDL